MRHPLAIVLLLLVSIVSCSQPSAGSSHRPNALAGSPTALPLPLLWIRDDTTVSGVQPRYMLMDWTGRRLGTLSMWGLIQQSPDGSRALVDGTNVVDATGTGLGTVQIPGLPTYDITWADDSRHLCAVGVPQTTAPEPSSLWLLGLGAAPTKILDFTGGFDTVAPVCSVAGNRAGVISMARFHYPPPQGNPYEVTTLLQIVNLATNQSIYAHDYSAGLPSTLIAAVASPDGRYLAEENLLQEGTTITDLVTGRTEATFPSAWLISFSPDDQRVAIHVVGGNVDETRVVDLRTGQILWKGQGSLGVLFRPGSTDFLVRLDDRAGTYDLLLVSAHGSPHIIARQVFVSW